MKAIHPILSWFLIAGLVSAAQTPQPGTSKTIAVENTRRLESQVRQSQLAPLNDSTETSSQKSLKDLTEQLNRLQLPQLQNTDVVKSKLSSAGSSNPQNTPQTPAVAPEKPNPVAETKTKAATDSQKTTAAKPRIADPVMAVVTANPQAVVDLFAAAEALFAKHDLTRAAKLYQRLEVQTIDNPQDQNRSWILFQLGNCFRFSTSAEAAKLYDKVIADYPESDWAKVARTRNQYIVWSRQAKPQELLIRYGYDPNSF